MIVDVLPSKLSVPKNEIKKNVYFKEFVKTYLNISENKKLLAFSFIDLIKIKN